MSDAISNMQKYANYREQMLRLKKAISSQFYLEAIFIEYAIMEDRLESVLRHSGKWHPKEGETISIYRKVKLVEKLAEQKKSLAEKYFPTELTQEILQWKDDRNTMIHALLKQSIHTEDLLLIAEQGERIVKTLCSKSTSYNRAIDKLSEKEK